MDDSQIGRLSVVDFAKPYQLVKAEGGLFKTKTPDVASQVADSHSIRQRFVERSNVGAIDQMIDMIDSFRDYESGQRAIRIQDGTLEKLINKLNQ